MVEARLATGFLADQVVVAGREPYVLLWRFRLTTGFAAVDHASARCALAQHGCWPARRVFGLSPGVARSCQVGVQPPPPGVRPRQAVPDPNMCNMWRPRIYRLQYVLYRPNSSKRAESAASLYPTTARWAIFQRLAQRHHQPDRERPEARRSAPRRRRSASRRRCP